MSGRPKILIIDDEPFNVDYLEQELEDLNYETVSAANGEEGLQQVAATQPDMILLDIMMPVMDGFEMLQKLKDEPDWRDIPVVIISAMNDMNSVVRGIQLGAEDYLPKPFDPVLLKARLDAGLMRKRLRDLEKDYLQNMEKELEIGRNIQLSFLPAEVPQFDGWEIAASLEAAREVAGDFYDVFETGDDICLVIGDVCDKGVGAALFMTLFRSLLRFTITADNISERFSPAEKLTHAVTLTNNYVANIHGETGMFATVFIGLLSPQNGKLTYINAGHERPVLIGGSGSQQQALKSTGIAVGVMPDWEFSVKEIVFNPGDFLFAYTDGVPEVTDVDGNFFGKEQLFKLLGHNARSASDLVRDINATLTAHSGAAKQFDDITMMVVKRLKEK
jgi:sigma-B regulation protein RsbU (phosphoserine phosphatase)